MELAINDFFQAKWSDRVHNEWISNLLKNRPELTKSRLENTRNLMNNAILDCLVDGFDKIEMELNLPDPNDNHILAAAIMSKSKVIVTYNLKDFPKEYLNQYSITAIHPDEFFIDLLKQKTNQFYLAVRKCHLKLKNPPFHFNEYLSHLKDKCGLVKMVNDITDHNESF